MAISIRDDSKRGQSSDREGKHFSRWRDKIEREAREGLIIEMKEIESKK